MIDGPVMLVTGTSRGIGLGIAKYFTALGYRVAGCSRGPEGFVAERYQHTSLDVGDEHALCNWIRRTRTAWKRIDALVCNAATVPEAFPLCMTSTEVFENVLRTNVLGTFFACREAGKLMAAQRRGSIVTLSSMAATLHIEGTSAYAASKSAITELTKILARELAPAGVTCNVVSVSVVNTRVVAALGEDIERRTIDRLTMKRALEIDEVCKVIEFLCAPSSSCITGQVVQLGLVS